MGTTNSRVATIGTGVEKSWRVLGVGHPVLVSTNDSMATRDTQLASNLSNGRMAVEYVVLDHPWITLPYGRGV